MVLLSVRYIPENGGEFLLKHLLTCREQQGEFMREGTSPRNNRCEDTTTYAKSVL